MHYDDAWLCGHVYDDFMHDVRGSENAKKMCNMCADMCDACAVECEKFSSKMEQCKQCSEACRMCAQECRNMMR